jgi:hypothetical protein
MAAMSCPANWLPDYQQKLSSMLWTNPFSDSWQSSLILVVMTTSEQGLFCWRSLFVRPFCATAPLRFALVPLELCSATSDTQFGDGSSVTGLRLISGYGIDDIRVLRGNWRCIGTGGYAIVWKSKRMMAWIDSVYTLKWRLHLCSHRHA